MTCVFGFHRYCLFYDHQDNMYSRKDVSDYLEHSFKNKSFLMNQRKFEPFESPKILGDIFESIIGAVYEDGGLDEVNRIFKHLLSPLILYNSKFSKLSAIYGEPKEQFQWRCHEYKIKPKYHIEDVEPHPYCIADSDGESIEANLIRCEIIFRNGEKMC